MNLAAAPSSPEVVDLRRPVSDDDNAAARRSAPPPNRRSILAGIVLVAFGAALGWLVASPGEPTAPAPDSDARAAPSVGTVDPTPGAVTVGPAAAPVAEPAPLQRPAPNREPTIEAGVTALPDLIELAGPITLVPGLEIGVLLHLEPDGTTTVQLPHPAVPASEVPAPPFIGLPLATVADGVLFSPLAGSLGAVAYWHPGSGISLPLPDEVDTASYLAAAGDLGIFLSAGDVVIHDLGLGIEVLRLQASIGGSPLVQVCVSPDSEAIALIGRNGQSQIYDMDTGRVVGTFSTTTTLRGVAWSGPGQIVYLVDGAGSTATVRALDTLSGAIYDVAMLQHGSNWKLATEGPSC